MKISRKWDATSNFGGKTGVIPHFHEIRLKAITIQSSVTQREQMMIVSRFWGNGAVTNNPKTNFAKVAKTRRPARRAGEVKILKVDGDGNLRVAEKKPLTEQQMKAREAFKNPPSMFDFNMK